MASKPAPKLPPPTPEKTGGYGSGLTPATRLHPPAQGVKPAPASKR